MTFLWDCYQLVTTMPEDGCLCQSHELPAATGPSELIVEIPSGVVANGHSRTEKQFQDCESISCVNKYHHVLPVQDSTCALNDQAVPLHSLPTGPFNLPSLERRRFRFHTVLMIHRQSPPFVYLILSRNGTWYRWLSRRFPGGSP